MWVTNLYIHVQLRYQLTTARFPLIFHVSMNFIPSKSITNSSLSSFLFFLFTNSISRYPKSYPARPLFPWKSFSREIGRRRRRRKISNHPNLLNLIARFVILRKQIENESSNKTERKGIIKPVSAFCCRHLESANSFNLRYLNRIEVKKNGREKKRKWKKSSDRNVGESVYAQSSEIIRSDSMCVARWREPKTQQNARAKCNFPAE